MPSRFTAVLSFGAHRSRCGRFPSELLFLLPSVSPKTDTCSVAFGLSIFLMFPFPGSAGLVLVLVHDGLRFVSRPTDVIVYLYCADRGSVVPRRQLVAELNRAQLASGMAEKLKQHEERARYVVPPALLKCSWNVWSTSFRQLTPPRSLTVPRWNEIGVVLLFVCVCLNMWRGGLAISAVLWHKKKFDGLLFVELLLMW